MKTKAVLFSSYILFILIFVGCKKNNENVNGITSFDVSPEGDFIIYSIIDHNKSSLYKAKIDGTPIKSMSNKQNYSFFCPKISTDGKTVFFIGNNNENMESSIWRARENDTVRKIFEDVGFISEINFSRYENYLFYIKATEYGSYSPIAPKANHNFDIYSININGTDSKRLSALKAYGLYDLQEFDKNKLIVSQRGIDEENGIFFYNKDSSTKLEKIKTINDTLRHSTGYSNPIVLDNNTIICASYYQLMKIDLKTKLEKNILPSNGYHFKQLCYNKKTNRIFFTKRDNTNKIYSIGIDGNNFKEIILSNR